MTDVSAKGSAGQRRWKKVGRELGEDLGWKDGLLLLLGSVLGFAGNAFFGGEDSTGTALLMLGFLMFCAAISISRFRAEIEAKSITALEATHNELNEKLKKHLAHAHTSAYFVPDKSGDNGALTIGKVGYDSATAAVRGAQDQILVIGDYCPPPGEDATLDKPPEHRLEYLQTIEEMLNQRLEKDSEPTGTLHYRRFIQRPRNIYNQIVERKNLAHPGVLLKLEDMSGDEQVFRHCRSVLNIVANADKKRINRIRVEIKVTPFLPNCPSILLVDNRDVLLAIPTRIERPDDRFGGQGLFGSIVIVDKAEGSEICDPLEKLFDTLTKFSVTVIRVENEDPDTALAG